MQHRVLRWSQHRLKTLTLLWVLSPALAMSPVPGTPPADVSLNQLALRVADGPEPLRSDLAYVAISELANAYAREAQRARQEYRNRPADADLRSWAGAVESMATELSALAKNITAMTSIDVGISPENSIYLIVEGKPVVVSGPKPNEQKALEQRIIEGFCRLNWCDALLENSSEELQQDDTKATPLWRFGEKAGPVCATHDGLEFQFRNTDHLREKREACARIVAELNMIAAAISKRLDSGTRVDWNAVTVRSYARGQPQRVLLNTGGEYLPLTLPALAATPDLFSQVRPWLAAKVTGGKINIVVINAGGLLAPLGIPEY